MEEGEWRVSMRWAEVGEIMMEMQRARSTGAQEHGSTGALNRCKRCKKCSGSGEGEVEGLHVRRVAGPRAHSAHKPEDNARCTMRNAFAEREVRNNKMHVRTGSRVECNK